MELLSASTAFASIIGLICNFKAERKIESDNEYQEFISWLQEKKHKSVIEEVESNHLLGLSIK